MDVRLRRGWAWSASPAPGGRPRNEDLIRPRLAALRARGPHCPLAGHEAEPAEPAEPICVDRGYRGSRSRRSPPLGLAPTALRASPWRSLCAPPPAPPAPRCLLAIIPPMMRLRRLRPRWLAVDPCGAWWAWRGWRCPSWGLVSGDRSGRGSRGSAWRTRFCPLSIYVRALIGATSATAGIETFAAEGEDSATVGGEHYGDGLARRAEPSRAWRYRVS